MIRRFGLCLLALALAVTANVAADDSARDRPDPPLRLKKKEKPSRPPREKKLRPDPEDTDARKDQPAHKKLKPEPREGDARQGGEPDGKDPAEEAKEALARAAKNMRASEERLAKRDPGEGTRQIQRDVLLDLDSLIKQTQRQQQQQQQQQQNNTPKGQARGQRPQRGTRKGQRQQTAKSQKPGQGQRQREGRQPGQGGGDGGKTGPNKIADLYKDVWGHLPETLRQEMDQYSREQFMAKYNDLLKQYYATIAEKGRRKAE
jgi:hypothetical protein